MPSTYNDNFTSSILIWLLFISYLITWLGLPVLCWTDMVRVSFLVLFPNLVERLSTCHHWVLYWLWVYHKWLLLCRDVFTLYPIWWGFFNHSLAFSLSIEIIIWVCFFFSPLDVGYHINLHVGNHPFNLEWIQLDYSILWSFLCVVSFSLLIFCWRLASIFIKVWFW